MKLTTKTLQNILLNGTNQIQDLPNEVANFLQDYTTLDELEQDTTEEFLKTLSILSVNQKIRYQMQGAPLTNKKPNSLSQKKQALSKQLYEILVYIFNYVPDFEKKMYLQEFIPNFDYNQWLFPPQLTNRLLYFGKNKPKITKDIINIIGDISFDFATYNPSWSYINQLTKAEENKKEGPKPFNPALIEFAKTRIQYYPEKPVDEAWVIDLPNMITPEFKALGLKDKLYKDAGNPYYNFIIQLVNAVPPSHWIGEDNPNKMAAYRTMLEALTSKRSKNKGNGFYRGESTEHSLVRGLEKAATHYQDKDLIMAQYSLFIPYQNVSMYAKDFIIGTPNEGLLTDEDRELLLTDFPEYLKTGKMFLEFDEPGTDVLINWKPWSKKFSFDVANSLIELYTDNSTHYRNDNEHFGFFFPLEYVHEIYDLLNPYKEKPNMNGQIHTIISVLKRRILFAETYKK